MNPSLPLRHLLLGLYGLVALIALIALGLHISTAHDRLDETSWLRQTHQIADLALEITIDNGLERGLGVLLLNTSADPRALPNVGERLRKLRATEATKYTALQQSLAALGPAGAHLQPAIAQLAAAREQLAAAREEADACHAGQRCLLTSPRWLATINAHIGAVTVLRRLLRSPRAQSLLGFVVNPLIKEVLYSLIEHAGRERALTGAAIAAGHPLTSQELETVLGARGVIEETTLMIDEMLGDLPPGHDVAAARARMQADYQQQFGALRQQVYAASARGTAYPVSALEWFDSASAGIDSIVALAKTIERHTRAQVEQEQRRAWQSLTGFVSAGIVVLLLLPFTLIVLRNRFLRPLDRLSQAARTIGGGDLTRSVGRFHRDELGELANGFETMRVNLLAQIRTREQALAVAEQLRRAVEQTADMVVITDAAGRIEYVNASFERITGYCRDEVIGQLTNILKSGQHTAAFYQQLWNTIQAGRSFHALMVDLRKDGALIYLEETITPLRDETGEITHHVCTAKDLTEREQLERHLQHSERLTALGRLAAGMAHEINNPVGFVHSNLGALQQYFEDLLTVLEHFESHQELIAGTGETGRAWLAKVNQLKTDTDYEFLKRDIPALLAESKDGLGRVRRIVQDLRDFSRADNQQDWERADLRGGLDSTLNIAMNEIKHRADVVKDYAADLPLVECHLAQLNQVFLNLLVNAAQAMPEGRRGTITLRCGSAAGSVWVEVADDGTGISPENLKKIFDPFFTTKPVGKGTGLGLSLSYGIIEKHHGRIEVNSTPGVGTTFRITLPIDQPPASSASSAASPAPSFNEP